MRSEIELTPQLNSAERETGANVSRPVATENYIQSVLYTNHDRYRTRIGEAGITAIRDNVQQTIIPSTKT